MAGLDRRQLLSTPGRQLEGNRSRLRANYLLDFNCGQFYYRPGYMLVAVLRRPDVASDIHRALHQTMLAFYCREFTFDQASFNSTGCIWSAADPTLPT